MNTHAENEKSKPIGIFDSGIGGLTVVKSLLYMLPKESLIYFGDTARLPYGTKSKKTLIDFSLQNVDFLLKKNVKLIVVACNSASSAAIKEMQEYSPVPVIGVIEPGAISALNATKSKYIGIIGTRGTVQSGAYYRTLITMDSNVKILQQACPLLVPLIEEGWLFHQSTKNILSEYLVPFKNEKLIDVILLGCTHYPLLKHMIKEELPNVEIVDSASATSVIVEKYLQDNSLLNPIFENKIEEYYLSDITENFITLASEFLGKSIADKVKLYKNDN